MLFQERCRHLSDTTLNISFPSLFTLANLKDAWIVDIWDEIEEGPQWSPCFSKLFNGWELESVEAFLAKLQ